MLQPPVSKNKCNGVFSFNSLLVELMYTLRVKKKKG